MLNSPIDEIKNRLNILDVVGSYLKLQKTGINYRANCPFHSEKKPSFFISPARQLWRCFGCGKGGDIFGFVKEIEGIEFGDALRILAQKAGVELKKQDPKLQTERQRLYEICELASRFFEKQLAESSGGKEVQKYLSDRKITEESIKKWRLGYAPDTWQGLSDFLVSNGYRREEIVRAGLAVKKEEGSGGGTSQDSYDRFRGRIVFPIFDLNSQIIGFGARIFGAKSEKEIAKYINTPNTLLYDKSQLLYGLDRAKLEVRKKQECVLVEGYTDVIMSHQAGVENVVATSGTALTPYQLKIIKRYTPNLLTAFDMDVAGDSATKRGIDLAINQGFKVEVVTLSKGLDPADMIAESGAEWEKKIAEKKSIMEFYFESAFSKFDKETVEGKKAISQILLPVIKKFPNQIEQDFWVQALAKDLKIKEENIISELKKVKSEEDVLGIEPEEQIALPVKSRRELLEERLTALLLRFPENIDLITGEDLPYFSAQIFQILDYLRKSRDFEMKEIDSNLLPEAIEILNYISLKAEIEELSDKDLQEELKKCLKEIKIMEIKNKLDQISENMRMAELEKNSEKIQELLKEFNFYSQSRGDLEND